MKFRLFIFRPHIMGEENHNLSFQILPNLHHDDLHPLDYFTSTCLRSKLRFTNMRSKLRFTNIRSKLRFTNIRSKLRFYIRTILHFTKKEGRFEKMSFHLYQQQTFDVISEVNCVLLKRKRRFENIALYPNFDVISEVNCVLPRR